MPAPEPLWLIGPLDQDLLDLCLQRAELPFRHRFFRLGEEIGHLFAEAGGLLLIEPLRRLLPPGVWDLALPRIGLCSLPEHLPPALARRLLAGLDAVIPLDEAVRALIPAELPTSPVTVWTLGSQHRPLKPVWEQEPGQSPTRDEADPDWHLPADEEVFHGQTLFEAGYVLSRVWSPLLPLYERSRRPPAYFIRTNPGRLPYYLQRLPVVLMDESLNARHFQAMACGATLMVHRQSPAAEPLARYLQADHDYLLYDASDLDAQLERLAWDASAHRRPAPAELDALRLDQTLPQALAALSLQLGLQSGPDRPWARRSQLEPWFEALQLCGVDQPQALGRLRDLLLSPGDGSDARLLIELCFYQKLLLSPYSRTPAEQIRDAVTVRLQQIDEASPLRPERDLIQLSAWLMHESIADPAQALPLAERLLADPPAWDALAQPGAWQTEPVLQELLSLWPAKALPAWLRYQRALCLARLQRIEAARAAVDELLADCYFPAGAALWRILQSETPAPERSRALLERHPQDLDQALLWIQGLARTQPQSAKAACDAYLVLCRRHLVRAHELERFAQLRRELAQTPSDGRIHLLWEGPLHSYSSLAAINRRWLLRLQADPGLLPSHVPFDPPELPPDLETKPLERVHLQPVDLHISHRWPPRDKPPAAGKWASIIPWEFGVIPSSWVAWINAGLDRLWVPSAFVAHSFEISGVDRERLQVIPNGVDTGLLRPEGPRLPLKTSKRFKFLFVGGMIERKGLDLLLDAWAEAFTAADDVCLVIKAFGAGSHYALNPMQLRLQALSQDPAGAEILLLEDELSPAQMAALFRACDAYAHPYRGEGFGMPILEAMACGLPVIVPNAGPAPEFCPPEASWQVPTRVRFEPSRDVQGLGLAIGKPYFTEVGVAALADILRAVAAGPDEARRRGAIAAEAARAYDWEAIYPLLRREIETLAGRDVALRELARRRPERLQSLSSAAPEARLAALDSDPLLLAGLLAQHPHESRSLWNRALSAGLPLAYALEIARSQAGLWRGFPIRLAWQGEAPLPLLQPAASERLGVVQDLSHVDVLLGVSAASQGIRWLIERPLPSSLPPAPAPLWYSHPAQRAELLARGVEATRLHYQPLGVDFGLYTPAGERIVLEESLGCFTFLAIFDWVRDGAWQDLLSAYFAAFRPDDKVNLVLKPLSRDGLGLDEIVAELMDWLAAAGHDPEAVPGLTFIEEELRPERLPGLYRGADCFVAAHAVSGVWHLAAQACGLPVISCGHFPFLERPFAEPFAPGDRAHLAWLLRQHCDAPEPERGEAVREYLQPLHDRQAWQAAAEEALIRSWIKAP